MPNRQDYTLMLHLKSEARQAVANTRSSMNVIRQQAERGLSAMQKMFYATSLIRTGMNAAAAAGRTFMKALGPASDMEQYGIQLEVMLGNAQRASLRLKELAKYARETNFSPDQIFEAGNLMQAFGIYSQRSLRLAGDAANAFGKDIREVVTSINYLASGRGGEAFESLSRLGITRQKLAQYGVRFGKSGNLLSSTKEAMDALFAYMEKTFGGMTRRQAGTWRGVIQQLGGEWWSMLSTAFKGALRPLTSFVRSSLIPAVSSLGKMFASVNWSKMLESPLRVIRGFVDMLSLAADPATRGMGIAQLRHLGKLFTTSIGNIFSSVLRDAGSLVEHVLKNSPTILAEGSKMIYHGIVAGFRFGIASFRLALSGFSDELRSSLQAAVDPMERERRYSAGIEAARAISHPSVFKNIMSALKDAPKTLASVRLAMPSGLRSRFEQEWRTRMFGSSKTLSQADYFAGIEGNIRSSFNAVRGLAGALGGWRPSNTMAALASGASAIGSFLSGSTRYSSALNAVRANRASALDAYRNAAEGRRAAMFTAFNVGWSNGQPVPYSARRGRAAEEARGRYESYGIQMERARMSYMRFSRMEQQLLNRQSPAQNPMSGMPKKVDDLNATLQRISTLMEGVFAYPGTQTA